MAATVNEKYTWTPTVKIGTANRQNARVVVWDSDSTTAVVDLTTNASGQIAEQELVQAVHSITGTSTVATDDKTPHIVRTTYIGDTDLDSPNTKYATRVDEFSKDLGQTASLNTIFLDIGQFVTHTETFIGANSPYTSITFNHTTDTMTIAANSTPLQAYEKCVYENDTVTTPFKTPTAIQLTIDGVVFDTFYDISIATGVTITCTGSTWRMNSSKDVTFVGTANISGTITVDGDVNWGTALSLNGLTLTNGAFDFTTAGTYTLTNCNIAEVTNSSGGAVIINAVNCTITTNTGPNITINNSVNVTVTCLDTSGSPVQGANVFIETDPGGVQVMKELTNSSGIATEPWNYSTDVNITGQARRMTSSPLYKNAPITGTITSTGFSVTLTMVSDE